LQFLWFYSKPSELAFNQWGASSSPAWLAYVYLRQSSPGQVLHNTESTVRQYALVDRAVVLGWPKDRVQVIDEDLGRCGASADWRSGFQQLVTEISLGHVGLVLLLEASRLVRNNGDWAQLLNLCSMIGTIRMIRMAGAVGIANRSLGLRQEAESSRSPNAEPSARAGGRSAGSQC